MKVIPLRGLKVKSTINVAVRAFDKSTLTPVNIQNNDAFIEYITIINKEDLPKVISCSDDIENILSKFNDSETFAILEPRFNIFTEFYDLKVALVIIYFAHRWIVDNGIDENYKEGNGPMFGYHTENFVQSTTWNVSIGIKNVDENNYTLTIPSYLTKDEDIESWRIPQYQDHTLFINEDISDKIDLFSNAINDNNEMAEKLRSTMYLMYSTLNFDNKNILIILYATILETLLLSSSEDNQRKKVAVRTACVISNKKSVSKKKYIANMIYYFYKYRNAIVHDGKSFIDLQNEDSIGIFNKVVSFVQHSIYFLIRTIIIDNIADTKEIKERVKNNVQRDNIDNGFDYINQDEMNFFYNE